MYVCVCILLLFAQLFTLFITLWIFYLRIFILTFYVGTILFNFILFIYLFIYFIIIGVFFQLLLLILVVWPTTLGGCYHVITVFGPVLPAAEQLTDNTVTGTRKD